MSYVGPMSSTGLWKSISAAALAAPAAAAALDYRAAVSPTDLRFGAKGDGTTDDGPALRLWRDHLASTGKVGIVPPGTYLIATWETVTIGSWASKKVGLHLPYNVGCRASNTGAAVFKISPAIASQLDVGVLCNWSGQGTSRNVVVSGFGLDCQSKADIGLMFYGGSDNHASEIYVANAAVRGIVLDGAQNLVCMHVQAVDCPILWQVLNGATSSHLIRCEGRRATSKHLLVDYDTTLPGYATFTNGGTVPPVNTSFYGCIWEECSGTGVTRIADIQQGDQLAFYGCFFVSTENTAMTELVYNKSLRIFMENCRHVSTGVTVAVPVLRIDGGASGGFGSYVNLLGVGFSGTNAIDIATSTLWNKFIDPIVFTSYSRLINTPNTTHRYATVEHRTFGGLQGARPTGLGHACGNLYFNEVGCADQWDPLAQRWRAVSDKKMSSNSTGAAFTPDLSVSRCFQYTVNAAYTIANPTNAAIDDEFDIMIIQDATGSRVATWGNQFKVNTITAGGANTRIIYRFKALTTTSFMQIGGTGAWIS